MLALDSTLNRGQETHIALPYQTVPIISFWNFTGFDKVCFSTPGILVYISNYSDMGRGKYLVDTG